MRWMWIPAVGVFLTACAAGRIRGGEYVNEAKGFMVPLPPSGWNVETGKGPDLLLRHEVRHAGISIHATCGGIPPDRPVEIASRHLLFGVRGKQVLREQRHVAPRHEALEVLLRGELDGRQLLLHGYTVKGLGCLYDLVLFAAPEDYPAVSGEFEVLVRGFRRVEEEPR